MSGTRDRSAREVMGTIEGGYQVLVDALAAAIRAARRRRPHRHPRPDASPSAGGRAVGVVTRRGLPRLDEVADARCCPPTARRCSTTSCAAPSGPDPIRYLGVVCLVLRLRRPLVSPYYALNITDRRVPLTTVVETTHVVDPERAGGTLIYVPQVRQPRQPGARAVLARGPRRLLRPLQRIFPDVHRGRRPRLRRSPARAHAEPVHALGHAGKAPDMRPAPGLAAASTADIYPELVNGQAVLGVAEQVVERLRSSLQDVAQEQRAA